MKEMKVAYNIQLETLTIQLEKHQEIFITIAADDIEEPLIKQNKLFQQRIKEMELENEKNEQITIRTKEQLIEQNELFDSLVYQLRETANNMMTRTNVGEITKSDQESLEKVRIIRKSIAESLEKVLAEVTKD